MAKLVFGFSRPSTFKMLSTVIMKAYSVPYSHSYVKLWSEKYQRNLIYQASSTMVNFMNQSSFDSHNTVVHEFEVEISEETRSKIMQFAIDNCGKPYGVKELLGIAWVRTNHWLGRDVKNPLRNKDTFICSGLVAQIIVECLEIPLPKHVDDMTPEDVYNLLKLHNFIQPITS
jgi:hypothetical protein